jgi:hypothetical protein
MIRDLTRSTFTFVHVLLSLAGIASGLVVGWDPWRGRHGRG